MTTVVSVLLSAAVCAAGDPPVGVVGSAGPLDLANAAQVAADVEGAAVVRLGGDSREHAGALHRCTRQVLAALWEAGFRVLAIPAGLFEVDWAERQLNRGAPPDVAASVFYRVWREDPEFLELLAWLAAERRAGREWQLIGSVSRFHAVGKGHYEDDVAAELEGAGPERALP